MTVVGKAHLATLLLAGIISCGGGSTSTPPPPGASTTPTLTGFSPASGAVGATVTITGTHLTGATAVSFNGTTSSYTVTSSTQITATVPTGATTGKISVTTPQGTVSSTNNFAVSTAAVPTITGFSPTSGQTGSSVTITGTNFTGATALTLNGTSATFTVNSATQIGATIPSGATTGKFAVTTPAGTGTSTNSFTVTTSSSTLDLTIDGLYVTQATQTYPTASVPLVKDRSGWVRVFVLANIANTATPQVQVDFGSGHVLTINAPGSSVPTSIDANVNQSWNAAVPAAWIQQGTEITATVDPTNAFAEADESNNQFSATLDDVQPLHTWKVTLVPVHTKDGRTGVVESGSFTRNNWVDFAKRLHPVPDAIDVTVSGTLNSNAGPATGPSLLADGTNWGTVLNEVTAKRSADGATASDRYYFGVVKVSYGGGVAGLGWIGQPAAMGWDYQSSAPSVLAHEEGHNFGRPHSPCGGADSPDPNYPYTIAKGFPADGIIGVPGWDVFASSSNLKNKDTFTDIMGYCSNQWISDYVYNSELNFRASKSFDVVSADSAQSSPDALLVWGRIENGNVILEPAFKVRNTGAAPEPGPYTWQAKDALGQVLMTVPFDAAEVADLPNTQLRMFSFLVPISSDTMTKIQSVSLLKEGKELIRKTAPAVPALAARAVVRPQFLPNRRMQFTWDAAQSPMVMLRDANTGEVRGFLSGGSATADDIPDNVEVVFSDGIHSEAVTYQRPVQ